MSNPNRDPGWGPFFTFWLFIAILGGLAILAAVTR